MKNIFKIITLENGAKIELKSFNIADKKEISTFLETEDLYTRVFLWAHMEVKDIIVEFEKMISNGDNVLIVSSGDRVVGIGVIKRYEEYYFRHLLRFYFCIDKSFWGTGLTRELIEEMVFLSMEEGKEKIIIQLLPDMNDHRREIQDLDFEQVAVLPEFFMDERGMKRDILVFANYTGQLWKSFEEGIDLQFKPHPMED